MVTDRLRFTERLHKGKHSRISRGTIERAGGQQFPVIIKQLAHSELNKTGNLRLGHEFSILSQLELDVICKPLELRQTEQGNQVLFQDAGSLSVRRWLSLQRPGFEDRLKAALHIARALGQIHEAGIIHKQISPDNLLINPETLQIKVIDFSLSSRLQREHPVSLAAISSKQDLAYIAPEQTGRINRVIDYRSDYYGLGATFYEMFTGAPPFQSDDSLELIHCHLARQPVEPYIQNTDLPEPLSQIIMKLLAKDAGQRYQSCLGLCKDLQAVQSMNASQKRGPFSLGKEDISERFELPQKLYGREDTVNALRSSFDAISRGRQSLTLITGYAGIGKSSLAHEIRHYITQHHGFFAAGKFDQYHRNRPYSAIYQALQVLIRQLLTESDDRIQLWREELLKAAGSNVQVLFRLIPELELILGKQPTAPRLPPTEEQHRFSHVIRQILRVFATAAHPLVLFFDDLHWADLSSLKLLSKLSHNPQHPYLLIIGSYRDQDVSHNHPFKLAIEHLKQAPVELQQLEIHPLQLEDITQLVMDTLGQPRHRCAELARICVQKTRGNPFFLNQFLLDLYDKGLISFQNNGWTWDDQQIRECEISNSVIDFMVDKLQRLSTQALEVLKVAACIGNPVPLHILARVCRLNATEAADNLWQALTEGLLLPLGNSHLYDPAAEPEKILYRFVHDRVQQAAYSLISQEELAPLHYQIGQELKASLPIAELGRRLFDVTNHLNQSQSLISTEKERTELARLNLKTGIRAKESAAFESAFEYFTQGLSLLKQQSTPGALLRDLQKHAAETAYIRADFDFLDRLLTEAIPNAETLPQKTQLEELRIHALVAQNQFSEALRVAIRLLQQLKTPLPLLPSARSIALNRIKLSLLLQRYSDKRILSLPSITDPTRLAAMSLLANMFGVVKFSSSGLRPLVMAKEVELTLRHGLSAESPMAFAGYAGILCGKYGQIPQGLRLGNLAIALCEQLGNPREHQTHYLYNAYVRHFKDPLRSCADSLFDYHIKALEGGDIEWSAYLLAAYCQYEFALSNNLSDFAQALKQYVLQLRESGQQQSLDYTLMTQQTVATLTGPAPAGLDGSFYHEEAMLDEYRSNNHRTAICLHFHYKGLLAFIYQDYAEAEQFFAEATEYAPYISGTYTAPQLEFFSTLNSLILLEENSVLEHPATLKRARRYLKQTEKLCRYAPENHRHHYLLVKAMLLTAEGRFSSAIDLFDQASSHAQSHQFTLDYAICLELTGHCYRLWQKDPLFQHYLNQAHQIYAAWGAKSKTRQLEQRFSFIKPDKQQPAESSQNLAERDDHLSHHSYDITSVIKASQAISDEIMLEPLISTLLRLAIVNAGAQRAVLLMNHENLVLSAETMIDQETRFFQEMPLNLAAEILPTSIIHYVARTKENVVLGNASSHEMFQQDLYIRDIQPLSLLALPILYHSELTAILYLENNQSSDVFNRNRLETLQILASQAAISIENAKLYQSLEQSEHDFKSLFLNAVEGIFRTTPRGQFISANPALAALLDFQTMDEFHSTISDITKQCFFDDQERDECLQKLDREHKVVNFETRWRKKSGEPLHVSISARKVIDANGQIQYYEGSLTDISERKAKEAAEQARHEAEAENEAKSLFLATMSHEIRTPMNGILGMAQLMKKGQLSREQSEQVETIYNAGQSLLAILNNILDYSKVESGQLEQEQKPFWLQQVLDETYNLFLPVAQEKSLQIVPAIDRTLPPLLGDKRLLNQILMNLCSNALKFTHQGYIRIEARGEELPDQQIKVHFSIEDTGIGIPQQAQEKIFQHFTQADSSITRRYGGTGLGLAITRQIIEHQGGKIGFESEESRGTTFWFELTYPLAKEAPREDQEEQPLSARQALDILLVEDTPVNQQVTQGLLQSDGHRVSIADDGFTALSMHNDHDYDLILMDIHLPDMDGVETTRRIRQHPDADKANIKIIALTASVTPHEIEGYLKAGMDGVLAKPIQYQELQALLRQQPAVITTSQPLSEGLLDLALLRQHREMLGDESLQQLLQQFHNQAQSLLEDLDMAWQQNEPDTLVQKAHTLSGAAANFGFRALQKASKALENNAETAETEQLRLQLEKLHAIYRDSCEQLSLQTH